ncbi:hypothetical protein [Symbioplanes lichenis]|uniref:hypothetical protein n=1 Tax=Symbioplanes lichenis TaxID=1629072 RepID=UPI00273A1AEE|nr:hypothetical protein [Actinoplanes lichenis]
MPEPDLHHDLAALAAHGSRVLRPRPVAEIIDRGRRRRRHQRIAGTTGLAAAVLGIAGGAALLTGGHPETVAPAAPPAVSATESPAPSLGPLPGDVLRGRKAVTLRTTDDAPIVAGYDDDDRVIVEEVEGKDQDRRNRWFLRPAGTKLQLVQVTRRPGGEVCATEEDNALRIRICAADDKHQQFTLAEGEGAWVLEQDGVPVGRDTDDGLVTADGTPLSFTVG